MIKQLAHVNFFSDRCEEILDFYVNKLGLEIKFTLDDERGIPFGWYVDCGQRTFIEIFDQKRAIRKWGGQVVKLEPGNRYRHLCFEVEDLAGFKKNLEDTGVSVTPIKVGMDNSNQAWIKDPDGNAIELMEYAPTSFQLGAGKGAR